MDNDKIVEGFLFETSSAARTARDEAKGIHIVKSKLDMKQPKKVLDVYNKLLEKHLCKTPIGLCYLWELQQYLKKNNLADTLQPIPVEPIRDKVVSRMKEDYKEDKKQKKKKENLLKFSLFLNITFAIAIILMMYIASTGNNPTILNYEEQIVNKYEQWEQNLQEREDALKNTQSQK